MAIISIRFDCVGVSGNGGGLITGGASAAVRNAIGFINAAERNLARRGLTLGKNRRLAVGIQNYRLHQFKGVATRASMSLFTPWNEKKMTNSVLDFELKYDATITLILVSDLREGFDELQGAINQLLPAMRFTNGSIFTFSNSVFVNSGQDKSSLCAAIQQVNATRSSFIVSRHELIQPGREFESFAEALSLFTDATENAKGPFKWHRRQPGWIIPLERGYQAVTQPAVGRIGARCPKTPSVVVTPVIGLGEFVSSKRFVDDLDLNAFWRPKSDRAAGFYLFNASSFND